MSFGLKITSGDLVIQNGKLVKVQGAAKLEQDLLKIALTEVGSNPLQPWYGSMISRNLIGNTLPNDILIASGQNELQRAIENLKTLQNSQIASGQKVSPDEQIAFIKNISFIKNQNFPTSIQIIIKVLSRAFGQVSATFEVNQ